MDTFKFYFIFIIFLAGIFALKSQVESNNPALRRIAEKEQLKSQARKKVVEKYSAKYNIPKRVIVGDKIIELQYIDKSGNPQYFIAGNAISAQTISTDEVYPGGEAGLDLDGDDITVHQWDAGSPRLTHQEFSGRAASGDGAGVSWHSTHVGGTIIASGVVSAAKGMAWAADLIAFDWNDFNGEMATEAEAGAIISNHSYGWLRGWEGGNTWWGDPAISDQEDYLFGFYDESAETWDNIVYNAPYFLIVKSAGNDRNQCGDGSYPCDGPYDCIDQLGIAKNNIVVAAVRDIPGGYTQPSDVIMSGFSSWGPADDGRIKPDISANGVGLYSTNSSSDDAYRNASGTSMSTPSVAGSVALLQQHYKALNGEGNFMKAATVKTLVIHTADEAGTSPGPDYEFGWGLMNTKKAALKISENDTAEVIIEKTLNEYKVYVYEFIAADTGEIKVTLAWTDPPGSPPEPSLDPPDIMLVNDLDLIIIKLSDSTFFHPWKLDKDNPSNSATNISENNVDNVEVVYIPAADSGDRYRIFIDYDGELADGMQDFSLIYSFNMSEGMEVVPPEAGFVADNTMPTLADTVHFTDISANSPVEWEWVFDPDYVTYVNGTDSSSQHPNVMFDLTGIYDVTFYSTNVAGTSIETKLEYITVYELLTMSLTAMSDTICFGDSSQLNILVNGGTGDYEYEWTSNPPGFVSTEPNPVVAPEVSTVYYLQLTDGVQFAYDNVSVTVNALPEIILGNWPEELCNEDEPPVQLTAEPGGGIFNGEAVSPEGIFTPEEAPIGWNSVTYTLEDGNNCINSATDSIYVDNCVGFGETTSADQLIKIYPVPNTGKFTVESEGIIKEIEIINSLGVVVYSVKTSSQKVEINRPLSKGIYLIKISVKVSPETQVIYQSVVVR